MPAKKTVKRTIREPKATTTTSAPSQKPAMKARMNAPQAQRSHSFMERFITPLSSRVWGVAVPRTMEAAMRLAEEGRKFFERRKNEAVAPRPTMRKRTA